MFEKLKDINRRPDPFEVYTADELWTEDYTAQQMLAYHLNDSVDLSSRNSAFIDRSVEWISSHFRINENTRIADFGCGPGLYTSRFAVKGANVTGIDFSENSLDYARRRALEEGQDISYIQANYLDFESLKKYDLISMIMCDFCALSPEQRGVLLRKFHSLLKPGGAVLLDVHSLNRFSKVEESAVYELNQLDGFWSPNDYYCFVNTFKYDDQKVSLDKYTIIEESRERVIYNWLQYFCKQSLKNEFEKNNFNIESLYADVAGSPLSEDSMDIAIIARK